MSIIPGDASIELYQGSTFDETWTFYDDDAETEPTDLTGWSAALTFRKAFGEAAILALTSSVFTPPAADGIVMGGTAGTVRIYVRDETLAAISHADWTNGSATGRDAAGPFSGIWQLELTNTDGETFRFLQGDVTFSREVVT